MAQKNLILILLFFSLTCLRGNNISLRRHSIRSRRETPKITGTCDPPEIENGKFKLLNQPDYEEGSPIPNFSPLEISCKKYYALYPQSSLNPICINSNWSVPLPKCIRTCPGLISTSVDVTCTFDGSPVDCTNPVLDGTVATSKCKKFYMSSDVTQLPKTTCRQGTWDGSLIKCRPDCGEAASEGVVNVVGGEKANQGEFPWHIALYRYENRTGEYIYKCGGSIVSPYVVISAAHCLTTLVEGKRNPAEEYHIGAGKYYSAYYTPNDTYAQIRQVKDYYIPPEYLAKESHYAGDLAVLIVQEAFELTSYVQPVCVDWNADFEREQFLTHPGSVTGWGYVNPENKSISADLRKFTGSYIDPATCYNGVPENFRKWVTTDKFCAGYTNGTSVCEGDSGGGMVFPWMINNRKKYYLRGLVSAGPTKNGTCDQRYYGVYTRISHYNNFILEVIRNNTPLDSRTYGAGYGYGSCSEPEIKNGRFDLLDTKYEEGFPIPNYSFLTVYCDEQYGLYPKVPYVLCVNETWSAPIPECRRTCPHPYHAQNCKMNGIKVPCSEATLEGAEVQSRCNETITSKCMDGMWSTRLPICDPCTPSPCGLNSKCRVVGEYPVCYCDVGFIGDPFLKCTPEPKPATN